MNTESHLIHNPTSINHHTPTWYNGPENDVAPLIINMESDGRGAPPTNGEIPESVLPRHWPIGVGACDRSVRNWPAVGMLHGCLPCNSSCHYGVSASSCRLGWSNPIAPV